MTTTPAQPEPNEREALAEKVERAHAEIARLCDGERWRMSIPADPKRDSDLILTDALDALEAHLAARPAPVVSADAVERAAEAAFVSDDLGGHHKPGPFILNPHTWQNIPEVGRENYRRLVRDILAALGITVADTPAADDEGGQDR